jgi:outer membrane protein
MAAVTCGVGLLAASPAVCQKSDAPAPNETLADAITLAYQTNPTLQAARASQRATDEDYVQARAGFRPTIGGSAEITHDYNQEALNLFGPSKTITNSTNGALVLTQPIYSGGKVASAVDAAKAGVLAGRQSLRQTEIQVLFTVVQAYVDVRRDQAQLAIAKDNVSVLQRQLDETNARFDVGEVTRTDVAQAQARLAGSQAQLSSVQASLAIAQASYAAVVGQNPGTLAPEPPISHLLPGNVDAAFDAAEHDNPQILQADFTERASAARVAEAKAEFRPTLSVRGSVGYTSGGQNAAPFETNPFITPKPDLTVSAIASVPLFNGGLLASQVRQEAERNNVDRINLETVRRQVLQSVSQAWNQLLGARASLVANEAQVKADTVAYEGTREEEQVGLRTTLDVLNAQQELENAELSLVAARHDEYVAATAVLAGMGALEAKDLIPGVPNYDPAKNFKRVNGSVGWVPWEPGIEALDRIGQPIAPDRPPGEPRRPGS